MEPEVLVTGGAGYIGSRVVAALIAGGLKPTVLDDLSTGRREAVGRAVRLVQGDVGDAACLDALLQDVRPQAVLHFAGSTSAPASIIEPLKYYDNNTAKTRTLIEAVLRAPRRPALLFSSTAAVYGAPDGPYVAEDAPTCPLNPYGASKLMSERMLADVACAHGLDYVVLRYFNVAGAAGAGLGKAGAPGSLLAVALEAVQGLRSHVPVYGVDHPTRDGTCVRDYIHVEDLAAAHLAALPLARSAGSPKVFNCGYGRGWSVLEVLAAVEQACGAPIRRVAAPRRAGDPSEVVADNSRLLRHTDWRPQRDDLVRLVGDALAAVAARAA